MSTQPKGRTLAAPFAPHATHAAAPGSEAAEQEEKQQPPATVSALDTKPHRLLRPLTQPHPTLPSQTTAPLTPPSGIQALAAELHQAAIQGLFEYPQPARLATRGFGALLVMLSFVHLTLVAFPAYGASHSWATALLSWQTAGAILGMVVAVLVAVFLAEVLPSIRVTPKGLGVSALFGWRVVPWKQLGVLRVMSGAGERYVVLIPFKGRLRPPLPVPMLRILPVLWGASTFKERGVVVTSDIKNFERLLQLVVSYVAQESGQAAPAVEKFVEEHVVMPAGQLVVDREAALARLARAAENEVDPYGVAIPESDLELPWRKILTRQALVAAAPALMLIIDGMQRHGEKASTWEPFVWGLALLVVGVAELPFAAKLIQAIGDLLVGSGKFKKSIWAYLELQAPRVALVVLSLALLSIGTPPFLAMVPWIVGIIGTTVLSTRFVEKLYFISAGQALLAAVGIFMYQVAMFVFYIGVR